MGRASLLSLILWSVYIAGIRIAVIPPEDCGETSVQAIDSAARNAAEWIRVNQNADGTYLYLYEPSTDTLLPGYSEVRHAGVTMALYQAAGGYTDDKYLAAGDQGLAWMTERTVQRHGWTALASDRRNAKLGAAALMAAALTERRAATGDGQYDDLTRELGRFMLALQRDDGGFHANYDLDRDEPVYGSTSRYYPGEAAWALALLAKAFPDEGWDDAALKATSFLTTKRDDLEDVDFPPLADQWAAYVLAEVDHTRLSGEQIDYARRLAGRFGLLIRTEAQREDGPLGRFVRGRESRAAGAGTWVEGLAALWRLASADGRLADLRGPIRDRLACAAGILAARQITPQEAAGYPSRERVAGAWVRADETRMDDQQHAFSGLLYTGDAIRGRVQREAQGELAEPGR